MDELVITLEEPDADVYILEGSDIRQIVKEFRGLIGRSYIPPDGHSDTSRAAGVINVRRTSGDAEATGRIICLLTALP